MGLRKIFLLIISIIIIILFISQTFFKIFYEYKRPEKLGLYMYMYYFTEKPLPWNYTYLFDRVKTAHIDIILPFIIDSRGYAYYNSTIVPKNEAFFEKYYEMYGYGRDPLKDLIDMAHDRNISVWIWFTTTRVCREILEKHRDWACVSVENKSCLEEPIKPYNLYSINPANPDARKYILNILEEVVSKYNVDGIVFQDDLGFPIGYDYSSISKRLFMNRYGITSIDWPKDVLENGRYHDKWVEWRIEVITEFIGELYFTVKKHRNIVVGAAVSYNLEWSRNTLAVDWIKWVEKEYVDFITPMLYHRDLNQLEQWIQIEYKDILNMVKKIDEKIKVYASIGGSLLNTGNMPPREWVDAIKYAVNGGSKYVLIFADICVDKSNAWNEIGKYMERK